MAAKKTEAKKVSSISKSALINALVEESGELTRKQVKSVLDAITDIATRSCARTAFSRCPASPSSAS